jgi:hypothetical protein
MTYDAETHYSNGISKDEMACRALRKKYGITLAEHQAISTKQGHVCAICGGTNPSGRRLVVDHNHTTDAVRELLCINCNVKLGVLEDEDFVAQAQKYLDRHKI